MEGFDTGTAVAAGSGWLALVAREVWNKFFSTEGKAHDGLINSLNERISAQEQRLINLEAGLDEERRARREAEDKVHRLEMDNMQLRLEHKRHGIDIPSPR